MSDLIQFQPCRAKKKLTIDELSPIHQTYIQEQKIDGERYIVQTNRPNKGCLHGITSRRQSVTDGFFVEKTDRVPHIANNPLLPPNSMLDCEFVSSGDMLLRPLPDKLWNKLLEPNHPHMRYLRDQFCGLLPIYPTVANTVSIMGSLGPEAVRKQSERGLIWAYCFDIILYNNKSLTDSTQAQRRRFLASQLEPVNPHTGFLLMPAWINLTLSEMEFLFYLITDPFHDKGIDGGEGLILKDPQQKYNGPSNWYKLKRMYNGDVVYTGESKIGEEGKTGKVFGMAASLEIGVYHNDELVPVGWVSAIRDGEAGLQTPEAHRATWAGKAIECRHNGLQVKPDSPLGYTLRHPRFCRVRDDKNPTECTWDRLYEDASKKLD